MTFLVVLLIFINVQVKKRAEYRAGEEREVDDEEIARGEKEEESTGMATFEKFSNLKVSKCSYAYVDVDFIFHNKLKMHKFIATVSSTECYNENCGLNLSSADVKIASLFPIHEQFQS
ncbi:hypothetical protein WN51_04380 [Melipona quadrifasciata]|uniref:Uncharacterized protein n=1 Tax=Melipona quadrifasciata TaxID=166423 RepID=A0A0N0BCQ5_9HYME|nr:hypothetical protein WN51_04380 [Melipona quadrifasciata]